MAKFKFFGIGEADAEIKSADAAINPLLTAAKITTIEVNGKQLPATSDEVPLALKISNLAATFKEGAGDKEISEMTRNNTILADQAKAAHDQKMDKAKHGLDVGVAAHKAAIDTHQAVLDTAEALKPEPEPEPKSRDTGGRVVMQPDFSDVAAAMRELSKSNRAKRRIVRDENSMPVGIEVVPDDAKE